MYTILLVDDEPTARNGMRSCINWEAHDLTIVGEADNGAAALEKALELRPDIVLTDIRMPVMDGITLTDRLRTSLPSCKILVMSGYEEFSYAKKLMGMKVSEYLLKPVSEEELIEALDRLTGEIQEESLQKSSLAATDTLLYESLPQLKSRLLLKMLKGSLPPNEDLLQQTDILSLPIQWARCRLMVMIIAIDSFSFAAEKSDARDLELLQFAIANIAEEIVNRTASGFLCYSGFENVTGIIGVDKAHSCDIGALCQNIAMLVKEHLNLKIFIGVGEAVASIVQLKEAFSSAQSVLDDKMHKGKRSIVQMTLRYMEEHYNRNVSLAEAAQRVFVTPNYLSRVFKEEMNANFIDWLNLIRVNKAKELLVSTNLKTYEIAEQVGYKDYKYFSAMFKKIVGRTPKEYGYSSEGANG